MKIKFVIILILTLIGVSFIKIENKLESTNEIKIEWVENLKGNFSFKENWSYPEGVYKNRYGQLSCDGICPEETDRMKDKSGKIYKDSLQAFYKIIDTTHIFHSLKSEAEIYEGHIPNNIEFKKLKNGKIVGNSINNISGYSSLNIELNGENCNALIKFNSYKDLSNHIFQLETGNIKIDKALFENGIMKAVFDFNFKNTLEYDKELFCKGKIYSKLQAE